MLGKADMIAGAHLLILLAILVVILAIVGAILWLVIWFGGIRPRRQAAEAEARARAAERDTEGLV